MRYCGLFIVIFISLVLPATGSMDTATTGDWTATSTWSSNTAPASGDTLVIPFGDTVTVNCNCGTYANMRILVYGTLHLPDGRKINMTANGIIDIYPDGALTGSNNGDKIVIGGNVAWTGAGSFIYGPTTCDSTGCGTNEVLPIKLLHFRGKTEEKRVVLEWATATETDNDYFSIWSAANPGTWEVIGTVNGSGQSNGRRNYRFIDNRSFSPGEAYYRLEQTDFDGTSTVVSKTVRIGRGQKQEPMLHISPNPARDVVYLSVENGMEPRSISVTDMTGHSKIHLTPASNRENRYAVNLQSLPPGPYVLHVVTAGSHACEVLVVQ